MIQRLIISCMIFGFCLLAGAEDGHALWLRMHKAQQQREITVDRSLSDDKACIIAVKELKEYWDQTLKIEITKSATILSDDGFSIMRKDDTIELKAKTGKGAMYGAYDLLRRQTTHSLPTGKEEMISNPTYDYRILNHWDNLDGTIERGFAGRSIFSRGGKIDFNPELISEYARANASVGINGVVINNVNASPKILSKENIQRLSDIAAILRPYEIKVYLSVNFASPMALDSLATADPLSSDVRVWWNEKTAYIYKMIPDFGGFLVKANSEGQPGPMDFGRTHADGANMLAEALQPYGGIVMWRAFVYAANSPDRANQAYDEFMPLDGSFRDNVILQIKNGPIDFQPREPVSSLFFNLRQTNMMPEFQITQEYTGECIHTCFLAPMWKEFWQELSKDAENIRIKAVAGVANIGDDRNWCGSDMAQSNWYAFARLAWDRMLSSEEIASEWLQQTYTDKQKFVKPMTKLLCQSREALVDYMMPMGLHHIFAGGHHYGPEPWYSPKGVREDWLPRYYHKADSVGLGFDRTLRGSRNVAQYPEEMCTLYEDKGTCPEKYILFFHHVAWDYIMNNGKDMWTNLCRHYDHGVTQAEGFVGTWGKMGKYVDSERFSGQMKYFVRQAKDAWWWRDACLLYFQQFSKRPLPKHSPAPRHTLDALMHYRLNMDNYTAADINLLP